MADQDEQQLLKVPGAVVGDSAMAPEVLGGFSAVSALARRKLMHIWWGCGGIVHWHFDFTKADVLYKSWRQESLQSFYLNRKIKMWKESGTPVVHKL